MLAVKSKQSTQAFVRYRQLVPIIHGLCFKPEAVCHRCHMGFSTLVPILFLRGSENTSDELREQLSRLRWRTYLQGTSSNRGDDLSCLSRTGDQTSAGRMSILFLPCLRSSLITPVKAWMGYELREIRKISQKGSLFLDGIYGHQGRLVQTSIKG